jgi:uncharacterized protein
MRYASPLTRLVRKGRRRLVGVEQEIQTEIRELRARLPHVTGVLVASVDGLPIAQDMAADEPERLAAMAAAQLGLGQQIAAAVAGGAFQETVTRAADAYVATFAAGTSALLAIVASAELNVGRLHHEARPVAARIGELYASTAHH